MKISEQNGTRVSLFAQIHTETVKKQSNKVLFHFTLPPRRAFSKKLRFHVRYKPKLSEYVFFSKLRVAAASDYALHLQENRLY